MIYTITFNPALDYIVRMDKKLEIGMTNRSVSEEIFYGGKGINVSRVLKNLDIESTALGFVAGFTGDELEKGIKAMGIKTDFIHLPEGSTRINVKLKGEAETEINAQGPKIDKNSIDKLFGKIDMMRNGDALVLAGSIPASLPDDIYEKILSRLEGKGVMTVVDASGELLKRVLKYKPFMIKPNNFELEEIFNKKLNDNAEIEECARELQKLGARNVLVSMSSKGAMLVDENGKMTVAESHKGIVKNTVGAGDSMVAGFIAGYMKDGTYETALKLGSAAGGATAFSDDLADGEKILQLLH
ncbi:MAG: 1-phosphofructokinase [Lachnospiraceae bacterium]|nr:1-phosphofructokinase [Lachnospiraceae bacterium]